MIPIVIDTDPGVDDAVAIMLALASPEVELRAVTTVFGNVALEGTTANAGRILALCDRSDVRSPRAPHGHSYTRSASGPSSGTAATDSAVGRPHCRPRRPTRTRAPRSRCSRRSCARPTSR